MLASSVAVSAWTLVAISLERYYAICDPLRSRRWQTLKHAYKLIALIWFASFIFMLPIAAFSRLIPTNHGNVVKLIFFYTAIVEILRKRRGVRERRKCSLQRIYFLLFIVEISR